MEKGEEKNSDVRYVAVVIVVVVVLVLVLGLGIGLGYKKSAVAAPPTTPPKDPKAAEVYRKAAVAADYPQCSVVGKDILKAGGSAVDACIASLICIGTCQFQSSGIGGGGFMLVYDRQRKKFEAFDYRETGPANLTEDGYNNGSDKRKVGGMAVGVPGEIRGLRAAWTRYGQLPWRRLFEPSIRLARDGFPMSRHLHDNMRSPSNKRYLDDNSTNFKEILYNANGTQKKEGDIIKRPKFAKTLETLSMYPEDMYTGGIAKSFVGDVQAKGGIMTLEDIKNYKVKERTPITATLGTNTLYTLPAPNGGSVLTHIMNINKGWKFGPKNVSDLEKKILTYHRIVEGFKFSYGYRPYLGDPDYQANKTEFMKWFDEVKSQQVAENNRLKINDSYTQPASFYSDFVAKTSDQGATHVSVLAENGDAAAATDTINYFCGAKFRSNTTGIVYNNELADFFTNTSYSKYPWPKANSPGAGKRPLSSTCPSIVVDKDRDVVMVAGASGGASITLSVAWVIMKKLWFNMELGAAVNDSRPQHSLFPEYIRNDRKAPLPADLVAGLEKKGHVVRNNQPYAVVQAIYREKNGRVHAKSDPRKGGKSAGY